MTVYRRCYCDRVFIIVCIYVAIFLLYFSSDVSVQVTNDSEIHTQSFKKKGKQPKSELLTRKTPQTALIISGGVVATEADDDDDDYAYYSYASFTLGGSASVELVVVEPQSGRVTQSCVLPDMPEQRAAHTSDGDLTCGGYDRDTGEALDSCITLTREGWRETHKLLTKRSDHCSWSVQEGVVLLGGLETNSAELVNTKTRTTKQIFSLKYDVWGACAIADGDSVILTGGAGDDDVPQHGVTRYNMMGYVEDLPELQEARHHHGCASFIRDNLNVFLVTGGVVGIQATTEIFQEGKWRYVGELPRSNHYLKCATLDNTVLVTGGEGGTSILAYDPETERWRDTADLKVGRYEHAVSTVTWEHFNQLCRDKQI